MLATIPNLPTIGGTTPEVTNMIEYASVPMENRICANAKLDCLDLSTPRRKSFNDFFFSVTST